MHNRLVAKALALSLVSIGIMSFSKASAQETLACQGLDGESVDIAALYVDNFAGWHSVGEEAWLSFTSGSQLIFHLCSVDNNNSYLIAQNSLGNNFNPGLFSRFEWSESNGQLFYCQQVYNSGSASEAEDFSVHPAADSSDPNDSGCGANGQFPWSQLVTIQR
ncbi:MAG: hypothetical protein AAFX39_12635 [Pseudomonadota bacterium]